MMDKSIWIVTDSNSGITEEQGRNLDIGIVPMPVIIDGREYLEGIDISRDMFFSCLAENCDIKTSQPSVKSLIDIFDRGLKKYDEIIYIPMSSAMSGSFMTAKCLSSSYDGRVQVIDNLRISCTQKQSVLEARYMAKSGFSSLEIKEILESNRKNASIYIAVDTLAYLKKGGRITSSGASIASVLDIKPVLQIQGGLLDYYGKARGFKSAEKKIIDAVNFDIENKFAGKSVTVKGAYTGSIEKAAVWQQALSESFPDYKISLDPLPLSISSHIGPGAIAAVCMESLSEAPFVSYEI